MSIYPAPEFNVPIYNSDYFVENDQTLSQASADARYLKLTGGTLSNSLNLSGGTIRVPAGSVISPSYGFSDNVGTGSYYTSNGAISKSLNHAVDGLQITETQYNYVSSKKFFICDGSIYGTNTSSVIRSYGTQDSLGFLTGCSLMTAGGASINKSLTIGTDIYLAATASTTYLNNVAQLNYTSTGLTIPKKVSIQDTEDSTSSSTGALQVAGGLYVAKQVNAPNTNCLIATWSGNQTTAIAATNVFGIINSDNALTLTSLTNDGSITQASGIFTISKAGMYAFQFINNGLTGTGITLVEYSIGNGASTTDLIAFDRRTVGSDSICGYRYMNAGSTFQINYKVTYTTLTSINIGGYQVACVRLW